MSYRENIQNKVIGQTLFVPDEPEPKYIPVKQYASCSNCDGTGLVYTINWTQSKFISRDCRECKGLGEVEIK
jgi:hypothetical protein